MKSIKSSSFLLLCLAILSTNGMIQQNSYGNYCLKGSMMLWYGYKGYIPHGWQVCDGSSGTPDMKGKFARGYSKANYDVLGKCNDVEGNNLPQITLEIENMPEHQHDADGDGGTLVNGLGGAHNHGGTTGSGSEHSHDLSFTLTGDGQHKHTIPGFRIPDSTTGVDGAHNHEFPAYYGQNSETTHPDDDIDGVKFDCVDEDEKVFVPTVPDGDNTLDGSHEHDAPAHCTTCTDGADNDLPDNCVGVDNGEGEHDHVVDEGTEGESTHTHSITMDDGHSDHDITGLTSKVGGGLPFEVPTVPEYVALYYICCTDYYDPWAPKKAQQTV